MPTIDNISNGLLQQHAERRERERERNMICETQFKNIGHCENVDEYRDIYLALYVQSWYNPTTINNNKNTTEKKLNGRMAI